MSDSRFRDSWDTTHDIIFSNDVLVECPKCSGSAIATKSREEYPYFRVICMQCGLLPCSDNLSWGAGYFYDYQLWLRVNCCGHLLWAYNKQHLDFLEGYISSSLRERTPNINQSLASRLPSWIKSSKNREQLVKGVRKLREKLIAAVI
ncbi:hypothetical protein EDM59_05675 [Brevibacillus nitrificans]|uniref:Uncharacterized protein n=1 Tax=Brevibacillus nitrificans TaxID=651560 RepID=A0A3M8DKQ5_9BACL|nr:hypothetical protein [Brevibacillus nitrificans]RNB88604.1 hypothetical protein EDM59_05675 [Brevibacillus nitrificans]